MDPQIANSNGNNLGIPGMTAYFGLFEYADQYTVLCITWIIQSLNIML